MTLTTILKTSEKVVADNSPTILTAMGIISGVASVVLTGKASVKASQIIREEQERMPADWVLLPKEKLVLVWKEFIPATSTGVFAIICVIGANRIGNRRAAAMAAAYAVSEKAWTEYKEKVIEKLGKQKEQKVNDELAQDRVNQNPVTTREVIITGNGDVLCYDTITGRYFQSNVEALRKAQNDVNQQVLNNMYASLYEFYDLIGLPPTEYSSEVGWNTDVMLELNFSTTLSEDGRPCLVMNYQVFPIRDYHRVH